MNIHILPIIKTESRVPNAVVKRLVLGGHELQQR